MDFNIKIPKDVITILNTLKINGYESYIVGGCVRDSLLNTHPKDWDITTIAKPEEIIRLFDKVILKGIKHGTVTVLVNSKEYEVTTYRIDGEYEDNRHPKEVSFVSNLKEDLARRDFTINAMAYNEIEGLIDYFQGIRDLNKKIIKTVGNPDKRFSEDALRMLRAIRFSSQLDFNISNHTLKSIKNLKNNITKISKERIREEFNKILLSSTTRGIDILNETGLMEYICPLINEHYNFRSDSDYNKNMYNIKRIKIVENKIYLKLVMLFYNLIEINQDIDITISQIKGFLVNLKYDNDTITKVITLIRFINEPIFTKLDIKRILNSIGVELFQDLLKLKRAETLSKNILLNRDEINKLSLVNEKFKDIILKNECFNLKNLNINGNDLLEMGFKKGENIGTILNELLILVMKNPNLNNKETLINIVKEQNNI